LCWPRCTATGAKIMSLQRPQRIFCSLSSMSRRRSLKAIKRAETITATLVGPRGFVLSMSVYLSGREGNGLTGNGEHRIQG
jgi:hypothetical protein